LLVPGLETRPGSCPLSTRSVLSISSVIAFQSPLARLSEL
jgi:hypothetical protein